MSRRINSLQQIVQDLESRYGKSDADVKKLQVEIEALLATKEEHRQKRSSVLHLTHGFQKRGNLLAS
jgi:ABC-type transporter Mla subunit MlaD